MKKSKFLLLVLIILTALSALPLPALAAEAPEVFSPSVLLLDADSGAVLFEKNADDTMQPASTTKIMTALLTIEAVERGEFTMDDSVAASENCQYGMDEDSSNANPAIVPGEVMSVRDLLYCAMLASANEACNILAEYIAGSIDDFVVMMNERAEELGCTDTHFSNPSGLEDPDHYSTARDMAIIAMEAIRHELFIPLCSDDGYTVAATNMAKKRGLKNTNQLLNESGKYYLESAFGIKTGFFTNAGYCLVSAAAEDETTLVCVVLGGTKDADSGVQSQYLDTVNLYNWAFDNYSYQQVLSSMAAVIDVPVAMGVDDAVAARPETSIRVLLPNDFDHETLDFEYIVYSERDGETLEAPVDAGTTLGEVTVSADGRVFGSSYLVAVNSVEMSKTIYLRASINAILQQPIVNKLLILLIVVLALYLILVFFYAVQRSRHRRSLRRARRDRADRQALRENFGVSEPLRALPRKTKTEEEMPEEEIVDEQEQEEDARPVGERLRGFFGGLAERFRRPEDEEYDEDDEYDEYGGDGGQEPEVTAEEDKEAEEVLP